MDARTPSGPRGVRRPAIAAAVGLAITGLVLACGGGGGGTPELRGPFLIDFEDRPDTGFGPALIPPVNIGPGVVITEVSSTGTLHDFSTADGWGNLCTPEATAFSGVMMMGVDANPEPASVTITFDPPVARVGIYAAGEFGWRVFLDAYETPAGSPFAEVRRDSECPALGWSDYLQIEESTNRIGAITISGNDVFFDDLAVWRYE